MSVIVKDFVGTWTVRWVAGEEPWMSPGWTLVIGTGTQGAEYPFLNAEYETCVGFTVLDAQGAAQLSTADQPDHNQPLALLYSGNTLRWAGYYKGQPLRIFISAAEAQMPGGETSVTIYGSTVFRDPDQVGVWGADGEGAP